jgi:thiopurine S-methyltransferase
VEASFWQERWRAGQIGFHQSCVSPHLERHWSELKLAGGSVFVPLCGKSLDLLWLRDLGHEVKGVELSALAVEAFCMENGVPAYRRECDGFEIFAAPRLDLFRGDFFALEPHHLGDIAAIYDRAALVALPKPLRPAYVEHVTRFARAGTALLLITVEYPEAELAGPPFTVGAAEVNRLYGGHFEVVELERRDVLDAEPRMRARGLTQLREICYHMVRR